MTPWAHVLSYARKAGEARRRIDPVSMVELARDLPAWLRSQGRSGIELGMPWITFEAARHVARRLTSTSRVFEYGSGGSTIFLARRASSVVSVENDPKWFDLIREAVGRHPNVKLILEPGLPADGASSAEFASRSAEFSGVNFERYVRSIERFPDGYFDLLLIDGRARPAAFFHGEPKVKVGGTIVLDDSNRSGYGSVIRAAAEAGWPRYGHWGPKPYTPHFAETALWTKTAALRNASERG